MVFVACSCQYIDFIEFQTNECVSDDKETIEQIDTKSSTVVVVVVPRRFEDLLHRQLGLMVSLSSETHSLV